MSRNRSMRVYGLAFVVFMVGIGASMAGCNTSERMLLAPPEEQGLLRAMQTRSFETTGE